MRLGPFAPPRALAQAIAIAIATATATASVAALSLGILVPHTLEAGDDPHGAVFVPTGCRACHATHTAAGGSLTNVAGNDNLCRSCHSSIGTASRFDMSQMSAANLVAGTGNSHAWGVSAVNSAAGAGTPSDARLSTRIDAGKVVCSTCHNQHQNDLTAVAAATAGPQVLGKVAHPQGAGTGTVSIAAISSTAVPKGYLVEILTTGAAGTATFRVSNDGGISWQAPSQATGAGVVPSGSSGITLAFSGSFMAGPPADRFTFYVGYPFLRLAMDSGDNATGSKFCRDCHSAWTMDHAATRTYTGTPRSHPVGVALNANGGGYDRTAPLDADGSTAGDGNPANDLRLDAQGRVQCWTCHGAHWAPSSSAAVAP